MHNANCRRNQIRSGKRRKNGKEIKQRGIKMAKEKVTLWDTSETLTTPEEINGYLAAAFEDGDPELIRVAMANVAKARNMTQLASDMGVSRRGLYQALSPDGNPAFSTIQKFIDAIGAKLTVTDGKSNGKGRPAIRHRLAA
jgi:probable addiction module antidote protein